MRLSVEMAVENGIKLSQLDMQQQEFVEAPFNLKVSMKLPLGYGKLSGQIVRLNRPLLYSLKQASHGFHKLIDK